VVIENCFVIAGEVVSLVVFKTSRYPLNVNVFPAPFHFIGFIDWYGSNRGALLPISTPY
jgi:hypothetical protein